MLIPTTIETEEDHPIIIVWVRFGNETKQLTRKLI